MLILTRKVDEVLYIGDNISVTVVKVRNGHVRLGITAPPEIVVLRKELADAQEEGGTGSN